MPQIVWLCQVSAQLYHFHYTLHTVEPRVTTVCSFVILSFLFSKLSLELILTSVYKWVLLALCISAFLCVPHICICRGKRRGRRSVCASQGTKTKRGAICLCRGGWQSQKNLCEPSRQQIHSSPKLQRSPVIHTISCGGFHKAKGIRRWGGTKNKQRDARQKTEELPLYAYVCVCVWVLRVSPCLLRLLIFLKQVPSHNLLSLCCLINSMISGWIFSLSSLQKNTKWTHTHTYTLLV